MTLEYLRNILKGATTPLAHEVRIDGDQFRRLCKLAEWALEHGKPGLEIAKENGSCREGCYCGVPDGVFRALKAFPREEGV